MVRCDSGHGHGGGGGGNPANEYPKAFPEIQKQVPLNHKMDQDLSFGKYVEQDIPADPYPILAGAFKPKPPEDPIVTNYEKNLGPETKTSFSTGWERALAYHTGVFVPESSKETKTPDDVRIAVADYASKVHQDAPQDACKYLQIEEYRCLQTNQFERNPKGAAEKCVKWWDEWRKCQWDQAKFNSGTTYIEGANFRRRRPYIFYPDFKYA